MTETICKDILSAFTLGSLLLQYAWSFPRSSRSGKTRGLYAEMDATIPVLFKSLGLSQPDFDKDFPRRNDPTTIEEFAKRLAEELGVTRGHPVEYGFLLGYHTGEAGLLIGDESGRVPEDVRQYLAGGLVLRARVYGQRLHLSDETVTRYLKPFAKCLQGDPWDPVRDGRAVRRAGMRFLRKFHDHITTLPPGVFDPDWRPGSLNVRPVWSARSYGTRENSCFVLMPFAEGWSNETYKAITDALKTCGMECTRADDLLGRDVMEDVWSSLLTAEIVLAEVSGKNANVFYELGLAHVIGKPTVLLTQSAKDIPFDLNRFRHVIYTATNRGYVKLKRDLVRSAKAARRDARRARGKVDEETAEFLLGPGEES